MNSTKNLVFMIRFGKMINFSITNLFGEECKYIKFAPAKFSELKAKADELNISETELCNLINKHSKADNILNIMIETQRFDDFALAWIKKAKGSTYENIELLKQLGANETLLSELQNKTSQKSEPSDNLSPFTQEINKQQVIANKILNSSFKDLKKLVAKSYPERKTNIVQCAFELKGISYSDYKDMIFNLLDEIKYPEVFADIIANQYESFSQRNRFVQFIRKFKTAVPIETEIYNYLQKHFVKRAKLKPLKNYNKYTLDKNIVDDYLNFTKSLLTDDLNCFEKFSLASFLCVFSNKECTEYYNELANQIALEYLTYLQNVELTTKNSYKYYMLRSTHYHDSDYEKFVKLFQKALPEHCKKNGLVQEYIKAMFISGFQKDIQYFYCANKGNPINQNAYYNSESYKKFPISLKAVFGEVDKYGKQSIFGGKYPFFIIARHAKKLPNITPEILFSDELYLQGFKHQIFEDNKKIAQFFETISEEELEKYLNNGAFIEEPFFDENMIAPDFEYDSECDYSEPIYAISEEELDEILKNNNYPEF